jgi:sulfane dehydrogenase subunit SoxC
MTDKNSAIPPKSQGRRAFAAKAAALGAAALVTPTSRAHAVMPPPSTTPPNLPPWTTRQGAPVLASPYGIPSAFEKNVIRRPHSRGAFPTEASSVTPLQDLHGIITPSGLHYERHHAGVPAINPDEHRLLVHGLVDRPLIFTMNDLLRFPSITRTYFLECSGNTPGWTKSNPKTTVQDTHGLISCSEWTGLPLSAILAEAGAQNRASWVLAEGADAAAMTRSFPIAKALDDALLAYAQNGEMLRPEQGYPLRLFLPGFEGNMSVKWLRRLKLGDAPFETREETSKYTDLMPDGLARQFNFVMEAKSVITFPSGGQQLSGLGFYEIRGIAWSGRGRITQVEVSVDNGTTWMNANLQEPVLSKCLTRFTVPWHWNGQPAVLQSRARDDTGYWQPTRAALIAAYGTNYGYHYNGIHSWGVGPDGAVSNVA